MSLYTSHAISDMHIYIGYVCDERLVRDGTNYAGRMVREA